MPDAASYDASSCGAGRLRPFDDVVGSAVAEPDRGTESLGRVLVRLENALELLLERRRRLRARRDQRGDDDDG
jgi:hypothetical protein